MTQLRRLALASTLATLVLVAIGGLVRATESGLGCGDTWPHCPGAINRALIIEFSHRAAAGAVIILIGALVWAARRQRATAPRLFWPAVAAFGLVLSQALLGAVVVWLELDAETVVLHLGTAMALVALLIYITGLTYADDARIVASTDPALARSAWFAAASVLVLLLVGSYVSGRGAGYVFSDWPLMDGRLVPDLGNELFAVHFLHRALAGIVGVIVAVVCYRVIRNREALPLQTRFAHSALGLFALEIAIGAINVFTKLNSAAVTAHLAVGALIWASLVGMAVVSTAGVTESRGSTVARTAMAQPGPS